MNQLSHHLLLLILQLMMSLLLLPSLFALDAVAAVVVVYPTVW